MSFSREFVKGIWVENPVFILLLGLCPVLAVTTSAENGLGMGLASSFVLLSSNIVVSIIRPVVPDRVRIPVYIVIIASFVTIVDLVMSGYFRPLYNSLGLFIPLIVVNCIILGRAEAFASKKSTPLAIADALGMGLGFTLALVMLGSVREIFGNGTIFNVSLFGPDYIPVLVMILPPGAFLTLGILTGIFAALEKK